MSTDIQSFEKAYSSSEIAELVGIAAPTVRKYSQILEKHGYDFIKNKERRVFVEKDIAALKEMKKSANLENTAIDLAREQKGDMSNTQLDIKQGDSVVSPGDMALIARELGQQLQISNERYENFILEFKKTQEEQLQEFKNDLTKEMVEAMQDKFEDTVNEAVKMALATERTKIAREVAEEMAAAQEPEKKSFWKRLFK